MAESTCGFEGLMSLRTNVDAAIAAADRLAAEPPPVIVSQPAHGTGSNAPVHRDSGALLGGLKKIGGWVLGIGLIIAVRACIASGVNSAVHTETPDPKIVADTASVPNGSADNPAPPPAQMAPAETADDGQTLTKPALGTAPLSISELRYCLAERIRMDAEQSEMESIRGIQPERFNRHLDTFNMNVNDFNSRCYQRSFMTSDKETADLQIAARRAALEIEGKDRVE